MKSFYQWLESHMFRNIPDEALQLIPIARKICEDLTQQKTYPAQTLIGTFPDPFFEGKKVKVYACSAEEFKKNGWRGQGNMGVLNGQAVINYRIPMTDYDTIYHEIVHACDPKLRLGLSKSVNTDSIQSMRTPHEIDAYISGKVNQTQYILDQADEKTKHSMLAELANWLRRVKTEYDLEHNVPKLLAGFGSLHVYYASKNMWKRFTSILWNNLLDKNGYNKNMKPFPPKITTKPNWEFI